MLPEDLLQGEDKAGGLGRGERLNGPNSQDGVKGCRHRITPGTRGQGVHQCIEALVGRLPDRIGKRVFLAFEKSGRIGRVGVNSGLKPAVEDLLFLGCQ